MEKVKLTISKLFTVVAMILTIALCCVLFGCGNNSKDSGSNQDRATEEPDVIGNLNDGQSENQATNIYGLSYTGLCLSADIEEKEEYDIDDVTVELIYGVDIAKFNNFSLASPLHETADVGCIYLCAYNHADTYYAGNEYSYPILGETLQTMEKGEVKSGALFIDEMNCNTITKSHENEDSASNSLHLCADNLYGTEYEGSVKYDPYMVTCYKKCSVTLPRELFTTDEGCIIFGMYAFAKNGEELEFVVNYNYGQADCNLFRYRKIGDKIIISNVILGGEFVFDGTASANI